MTLRPGDALPVLSTKYDGSHHYAYQLAVVAVQPGHLRAWGAALVERAWRAVTDVMQLVQARAWPFDGSLYAWRPDGVG